MKHRSVVIRAGWTAALALLALLSGGSLAGAWNASAPAALAAYTEPEKAAQRQAGTTALKQMYAALDAKKSGYTFPPGVYRFTGSRPFNFSKKSNFAVHAAGCTFVMENLTGELFLIQDCSQMAIVGPLTLDADPLRFSQAKVMARNDGAGTADIQIMSGYPTPPAKARMMIFGPDGVWQSPSPDKQWPFLEYSDFTWQDEARKVGRIAVNPKILPLLKPGNYITLGAGDGIGTLRDVDGMTLQDITAYTGCTSLISWGGGSGVWHYTRVRAIPEPGTSRLIGGSGPQHSFGAGSTVVFDGCEFNGSTDDDLNVGSGTYGMLYKQETPRTILVMNGGFKSGDKVRVFENSAARETARALVQKAEPLEDAALKADARKVQSTLLKRRDRDNPALWRLTLDRDVSAAPADLVENMSARGELFVMRNCKWTNSTVRVMVQGFKKGIFTGNTFTRIGQGLAVTTDLWWWEGGTWDECVIRNNKFVQVPYATYWKSSALHYGPSGVPDTAKAMFGPVSITGNTILGGMGTGIGINAAAAYQMHNNVVSGMTGAPVTINGAPEPLRDTGGLKSAGAR